MLICEAGTISPSPIIRGINCGVDHNLALRDGGRRPRSGQPLTIDVNGSDQAQLEALLPAPIGRRYTN